MSFKRNDNNQLSLNDSMYTLTDREMKFLEKSWAKPFAEIVFPAIDEEPFSVLYSDVASRPNTPVNVILGSLILKEIQRLTDDEVVESLMFDIRFQYALHTTSCKEQPLSDRSLSRFRERCLAYEVKTGKDLIKDCITKLSAEISTVMGISGNVKRMDSMMISSNIKKLSRFQLLYTCVANMVNLIHKNVDKVPSGMEHYTEKEDYNRMVYHMRSIDLSDRYTIVLTDAKRLIEECDKDFDQSSEYQLLMRVVNEQTKEDENGRFVLKDKSDNSMNSNILQNPSDPDATFRTKAGKQHRGYAANLTEDVDIEEKNSIISDYDYDVNTHSDSQFLKDYLEEHGKESDPITMIADGAYGGTNNHKLAAEHNVNLVTTNFQGKKPKAILADFQFSEDGKEVLKCPGGQIPKTNKYYESTGQCRVTFNKSICERCPFKNDCKPNLQKKKAVLQISHKSAFNAKQMKYMKTEEFSEYAKIRNGVESLPSIFRRKYNVDNMPIRGKLSTKLFFGFKVAALNFKKLWDYTDSLVNHAPIPEFC